MLLDGKKDEASAHQACMMEVNTAMKQEVHRVAPSEPEKRQTPKKMLSVWRILP